MSSSAVGTGFEKYVYPNLSPNSQTGPEGRVFVVDTDAGCLAEVDDNAGGGALEVVAFKPDVPDVEAT